jgi:hypothetical protein
MRVLCENCKHFKLLPAYGRYCRLTNTILRTTTWCDYGMEKASDSN